LYELEIDPVEPIEKRQALDIQFSAAYEELRRLAFAVRRGEMNATLNPTALVNEAWLKLAGSPQFASASPLHFKRIAARAMRQVLIEAARRRNRQKRTGGEVVAFEDFLGLEPEFGNDLIALDDALRELERIHPRQGSVIESRFFGGFDISETAALLNLSEATVLRDWRAAKAWLTLELKRSR
jgi:RNA polymerase sigma factor (TIGR02999 family)